MRGRFFMKVYIIAIQNCPVILVCFQCRFIWFRVNLRNFNPRKIAFSDGFWYKTIFPPSTPVIGHVQSDVDFYGESYDGKHVTVAHCTKKFFYEKPRKSRKNLEYSRIFEKISPFFYIFQCVLSYELVKNKISQHRKNFEKSSEFSLLIQYDSCPRSVLVTGNILRVG